MGQLDAFGDHERVDHRLISASTPESNGNWCAFIKILSAECLTLREFASVMELKRFTKQFMSYHNQYRGHGSRGLKAYTNNLVYRCYPQGHRIGPDSGFGVGLKQWSGESSAEAPINVTEELRIQRKALVSLTA